MLQLNYIFRTIFYCLVNQLNFSNALLGQNVTQAYEYEFPYVVSIMRISTENETLENLHRCTGTIISRQDILTAEHCLRDLTPYGFRIMIGSSDLYNCIEYYSLWWLSYNRWAYLTNTDLQNEDNDVAIGKVNEIL